MESVNLQGPAGATFVTDEVDMDISGFVSGPSRFGSMAQWTACIQALYGDHQLAQTANCNVPVDGNGSVFDTVLRLTFDVPAVTGADGVVRAGLVQYSFFLGANATGLVDVDGTLLSGTADLAHTAVITQVLPPGWSYTSESGVFLTESPTEPPSPVPEPGTTALMLGGIAAMVSRLRLRNATRH
jgi:hypothetical protein